MYGSLIIILLALISLSISAYIAILKKPFVYPTMYKNLGVTTLIVLFLLQSGQTYLMIAAILISLLTAAWFLQLKLSSKASKLFYSCVGIKSGVFYMLVEKAIRNSFSDVEEVDSSGSFDGCYKKTLRLNGFNYSCLFSDGRLSSDTLTYISESGESIDKYLDVVKSLRNTKMTKDQIEFYHLLSLTLTGLFLLFIIFFL